MCVCVCTLAAGRMSPGGVLFTVVEEGKNASSTKPGGFRDGPSATPAPRAPPSEEDAHHRRPHQSFTAHIQNGVVNIQWMLPLYTASLESYHHLGEFTKKKKSTFFHHFCSFSEEHLFSHVSD